MRRLGHPADRLAAGDFNRTSLAESLGDRIAFILVHIHRDDKLTFVCRARGIGRFPVLSARDVRPGRLVAGAVLLPAGSMKMSVRSTPYS